MCIRDSFNTATKLETIAVTLTLHELWCIYKSTDSMCCVMFAGDNEPRQITATARIWILVDAPFFIIREVTVIASSFVAVLKLFLATCVQSLNAFFALYKLLYAFWLGYICPVRPATPEEDDRGFATISVSQGVWFFVQFVCRV